MIKFLFCIILFLTNLSLANETTYLCYAQETCQRPLLEYVDGKLVSSCTYNNQVIPEKGMLSNIIVDSDKIIIKDRFDKNIEITDFKKLSMSYLGYLDNYEFNLVLDDYFELTIREKFSNNYYRDIFYVYGYCDKK